MTMRMGMELAQNSTLQDVADEINRLDPMLHAEVEETGGGIEVIRFLLVDCTMVWDDHGEFWQGTYRDDEDRTEGDIIITATPTSGVEAAEVARVIVGSIFKPRA